MCIRDRQTGEDVNHISGSGKCPGFRRVLNKVKQIEMVKVLQGNMNRSRLAHDLLMQIILEHNSDIIIINEQYRNKDTPTWYLGNLGTAAIWVPDSQWVHVCLLYTSYEWRGKGKCS